MINQHWFSGETENQCWLIIGLLLKTRKFHYKGPRPPRNPLERFIRGHPAHLHSRRTRNVPSNRCITRVLVYLPCLCFRPGCCAELQLDNVAMGMHLWPLSEPMMISCPDGKLPRPRPLHSRSVHDVNMQWGT
jgi:hypothetical protein